VAMWTKLISCLVSEETRNFQTDTVLSIMEGTLQIININIWNKSGPAAGEEYNNKLRLQIQCQERICCLTATPFFV
jgi:hypothetical protein